MNAVVKLRRADSTAPGLPHLSDFPDFVAERDKLRQIAGEYDEAVAALANVERDLAATRKADGERIDEAARARIDGKPLPARATLIQSRDDMRERVNVLRRALMLQTGNFDEAKGRAAEEIIAKARPTQDALIGSVLTAAISLHEALSAEEDFRAKLAADGVVGTATGGAGGVFKAIPPALRAVAARGKWGSPLNILGRIVHADAWVTR